MGAPSSSAPMARNGKGVVVAQTVEEAVDAVNAMMEDHILARPAAVSSLKNAWSVKLEASPPAFVDG